MTVHETISIAVRLFAVWVAVYLLETIPSLILVFEAEELELTHAASVGAILLGFIIVAMLWKFPTLVARQLMPSPESRAPTAGVTERELCRAGFIVLGGYLLAVSIADGVYLGLKLFDTIRNPMSTTVFEFEQTAQVVATIVQAFLGIGLVAGSKRIRDWAYRLRYE